MNVKLLAEHHLEFLSLKGCRTGSPKSTHVKMTHFWKSHVTTQIIIISEILRDENIAIIAGSVAGVVMLTIVIIIIVLKLKKKL